MTDELFQLRVKLCAAAEAITREFDTTLRTIDTAPESDTFAASLVDGLSASERLNQLEAEHTALTGREFLFEADQDWDEFAIRAGRHTKAELKRDF